VLVVGEDRILVVGEDAEIDPEDSVSPGIDALPLPDTTVVGTDTS